MKIVNIDHITVNVDDLESSEQFYGQILGLERAGFIPMGDHTLTYYKLTDSCRLELIRYLEGTERARPGETDRGIYRHFCIETEHLAGVYEDCVAGGVSVRKKPSYVEPLHCDTMLITDPNGVEIELIERRAEK